MRRRAALKAPPAGGSEIIIDTGPLVAFLNRADAKHEWARNQVATLEPPFATCEAVLSEACLLLRHLRGGPDGVVELVRRGLVAVSFRFEDEATAIGELIARFSSVPMSFADACLVRMAELQPRALVFTLDTDFRIYRKNRRRVIPSLMPEA